MPSTGNPWLERNQREEKVAVKQSQALHHQMPFIHTLLLSIFLFFLSACLSSCGRGKKTAVAEKSLGQLVWSRTVKPDRPALFSPPLFWQTFALRLSLGPHLGFGNANQRERERGARGRMEAGKGYVPWEPQGKARAFGKDKQQDTLRLSLLPLICTSRKSIGWSSAKKQNKRLTEREKMAHGSLHM